MKRRSKSAIDLALRVMDSDDAFDTSVWASSSASATPTTKQPAALVLDDGGFGASEVSTFDAAPGDGDAFDDFDDFNEPAASGAVDDDFGDDFGDFGEVQAADPGFSTPAVAPPLAVEQDSAWGSDWHPLRLEPLPPLSELTERVEELLAPIYDPQSTTRFLSDETIRQAEGLNQTLVTPERCV